MGAGIGIGAHTSLFDHDIALGVHNLVGQNEAGHAIGLEFHHGFEMFAGNALEIGRVIDGGEGIFLTAQSGDDIGEFALGVFLGAFEHQMFEEMRDTGFADGIICRAVAVPDHVGHDRCAMIGDHNDLKTVVQGDG